MERRTLEPTDALRLLNGGPVVLVTTRYRTQSDVMPAIYYMQLSRTPPLIAIAVHPGRHTHDMIKFSEQFALNFPAKDLMNHTQYFGSVSGDQVGKLELSKLATFSASTIDVPLIENCIAWIECSVHDTHRIGDHTLFVGRVLSVQAESAAFDERWVLDDPDYRPLHYLGSDRYATLGKPMQAELRTTDDGAIELAESPEEREKREEAEALERERLKREGQED